MSWDQLTIAPDGSHHTTAQGKPAYVERFDEVLKFHAPGLAPVRRGEDAWHIRPDGSAAYVRRFARTFGYYEGLAAVAAPDGWHHIAMDGQDSYADRYAWCGNFQGGRCTVRDLRGEYFHIRDDGHPVYARRWCYAGDYRDGLAVVQAADGRSTHIDDQGRVVHGRWFLDLDVFHKAFARARDEDGWTHVDVTGTPIYGRRFAAVEPFYNSQARVERFDGALEVIEESGATVVELRPPRRSEFAALSGDMVGFWRTQTIAAAVRVGVIEALPSTDEAVAKRCGLKPELTHRLLRALGELRLVAKQGDQWMLSTRGAFLRAEHPLTLADAALEYAGPFSRMWEDLSEALRRNSAWSAPDVFGDVARDAHRRGGHHRMLRSYARHDYVDVPRVLELRGDERIIDAGGGLGCLARLLLETYPSTHVTVLERHEVVEQGRRESVCNDRLTWCAADLFERWELEGEAVLLARVLHDWDDQAAFCILSRARAALPVGGRVFIVEMVLPENGIAGSLCDLHLLMATGGRERSVAEFARLLSATAFELVAVRNSGALPSVLVGVAT